MTKLEEMVVQKKREIRERKVAIPFSQLVASLHTLPSPRDFEAALRPRGAEELSCIAEIKKASPSKGLLTEKFSPERIAQEFSAGGARALSVLTDEKFFQGHSSFVGRAKRSVGLPVLRKDFIIDEYQVYESRVIDADAILLIVALLDDAELRRFLSSADDLGMAALVECHTKPEIERALECGAAIIGVNNRDLHSFEVTVETSLKLKHFIPNTVLSVSESGIHNSHHVDLIRQAGFDAILVGEHLMVREDRSQALRELFRTDVHA